MRQEIVETILASIASIHETRVLCSPASCSLASLLTMKPSTLAVLITACLIRTYPSTGDRATSSNERFRELTFLCLLLAWICYGTAHTMDPILTGAFQLPIALSYSYVDVSTLQRLDDGNTKLPPPVWPLKWYCDWLNALLYYTTSRSRRCLAIDG